MQPTPVKNNHDKVIQSDSPGTKNKMQKSIAEEKSSKIGYLIF